MARTNRPDEAYHIPTLNFWFAISGIVLFVTSVWMILADHQRSWKVTQREFREVELTRLSLEKQNALTALDQDEAKAQMAAMMAEMQSAESEMMQRAGEIDATKDEISDLQQVEYKAKRDNGFVKAEFGDLRYKVETERMHIQEMMQSGKVSDTEHANMMSHLDEMEADLASLQAKAQDAASAFKDATEQLAAAQGKLASMVQSQKEAQAKVEKSKEDLTAIEKRIEKIGHNFFNDVVRNAPVLDFIAPDIKIQQIVIKDLRTIITLRLCKKKIAAKHVIWALRKRITR